jgi:hypothetical protein
MAVNVCLGITGKAGDSFQWQNGNTLAVIAAPVSGGTWPLPASSYTVQPNNVPTDSITINASSVPGNWLYVVTWAVSRPGVNPPCGANALNPKIVITSSR